MVLELEAEDKREGTEDEVSSSKSSITVKMSILFEKVIGSKAVGSREEQSAIFKKLLGV